MTSCTQTHFSYQVSSKLRTCAVGGPVLIWYEEDRESRVHDLHDRSKYLSRHNYNTLVNKPKPEHPVLEAGIWCMVSEVNATEEEDMTEMDG